MNKDPRILAANFTTRVGRRGLWDMVGATVNIEIHRGVLYKPVSCELVVIDHFIVEPHKNKQPIFPKIFVFYFIFNKNDVGLEIHLKEDGAVHAQLISTFTERGGTYEKVHVVFSGIDLGWFPYIQPFKR